MAKDPVLLFLSRLERLEARLLSWGLVDGSLTTQEIQQEADRFLTENQLWEEFPSEESLIRELRDRQFLHSFLNGMEERFRTRMAETIRLLARLRQLFPKHFERARLWQMAAPLVGDFRFMLRPRSFPRRHIEFAETQARLREIAKPSAVQQSVLQQLLGTSGAAPINLAKFQLRATEHILRHANGKRTSGTIVCAGTGTGKTLSFYLPALLCLADSIDANRWTRCLAVYPRNELLKDQLSETFRQARRIDAALQQHGKRKLVIGALFGATPEGEWSFNFDSPPRGWRKYRDGFVCPFIQCPDADCDGDLLWRDSDRKAKRHELHCTKCPAQTKPDELILTRDQLRKTPPDILFTTTEMMNQRIGDSASCQLFGVNSDRRRKPQLVLLDEVHTYSGVSGAQTALLLRRWQHAAGAKPHFVGLSATLADARHFFATLTGVDDYRVEEISPHPQDLVRQGTEYLVAVRGDPAARASLLSTTIQTAMLMRRSLDVRGQSRSVYGCREFVFTDDLDVTNRLFFNLRDAEGLDSWGRPDRQNRPGGSLANLRESNLPEMGLRQRFGQSWDLFEQIGHSLQSGTASMHVDRTSSQDAGIAATADIVIATASLEVGFNAPDVNVVVQHKAPRDPAQFLQRKGRAGRRPEMRPWTVVVLSDYGRDRLAWQSYDVLFDPELPPRDLPISNRYVLRIQAVLAFCDWVAAQLRRTQEIPAGSVWRDFSGPADSFSSSYRSSIRTRQIAVAHMVDGLLGRDEGYDELCEYLTQALRQPPDVIQALLWEPPRALMTSVLPTLYRRLVRQWQRAEGGLDYRVSNHPLPEFVPATLFGELNLPEVTVVSPPQEKGDQTREVPLPILQSLREFAPGRVSRRFGVKNIYARHWVAPPNPYAAGTQNVDVHSFVTLHDNLGEFQYLDSENQKHSIPCVRPFEILVQTPGREIRDSSNAFLQWQTQIGPDTVGMPVDLPQPSRWEQIIIEIRFFTHNHHTPLEVRRFATHSDATIVLENGQQIDTSLQFVLPGVDSKADADPFPVGIGFVIDVDGVAIRFRVPHQLTESLSGNAAKLRSLRSARFSDLVMSDRTLDGLANSFQRQWLSQIYVSALAIAAIGSDSTLSGVWQSSKNNTGCLNFAEVIAVIFQSIPLSTTDEDDDTSGTNLDNQQQRLQQDLTELLAHPDILAALHRHATVLWQDVDHAWTAWLVQKFKTTLGAAILDAVQQVCPELDAGDLTLDIDAGPRPVGALPAPDDCEEIWLTEQTVGGGGIIEKFLIRYGEDPRRFFDLVEAALKPSDFEVADEQLTLFLDWVHAAADSCIRDQVAALRAAENESCDKFADAFNQLKKQLSHKGLFVSHPVTVALGSRILRPGSSPQTDEMLHILVTDWREREQQLGIEIDARIFAYLHSGNDTLDQALGQVGGDAVEVDRRQWRFGAIFSLLWPRGSVVRGQRLDVYNPFAVLPTTEHDLVRDCLQGEPAAVSITEEGWRASLAELLVRDSIVVLQAPLAEVQQLRSALLSVMATPIDTSFMLLHPTLRGVERRSGMIQLTLVLDEGAQ